MKLPALSSLASAFGQWAQGDSYVAGLWKQDLQARLAWNLVVQNLDELLPRPTTYRAPSFSWASVDSGVEFEAKGENYCTAIESVDLKLATGDPYGEVQF